MSSPVLNVKITGNSEKLRKEFSKASNAAEKFKKGLNVASVAATAAIVAIAKVTADCVNSASELDQATGAVKSVYGEHYKQVVEFSKNASKQMGLSKTDYLNFSAVMGAQLKSLGFNQGEVGNQTNKLISLGADLAATFGGKTSEAVSALSSLLRGERDPIEKYGIAIKEADINARLAKKGMSNLKGEALTLAKAQATLELVFEQSGGAVGQFHRESDTMAGKLQIMKAQIENTKASIGANFLPVIEKALGSLESLSGWAEKHPDAFIFIGKTILGIAAAIWAVNFAMNAYTVAVKLAGVATKVTPFGWVVTALTLLISTITTVIYYWDKLTSAIEKAKKSEIVKKNNNSRLKFTKASRQTPQIASFNTTTPTFYDSGYYEPAGNSIEQNNTINITVNGALDPYAVARQIETILRQNNLRKGEILI